MLLLLLVSNGGRKRQREHGVHRPRGSGIHDGSVEQKGDFRSRREVR